MLRYSHNPLFCPVSSISAQIWSPTNANVFASASGDRTVRIWDIKRVLFRFFVYCYSTVASVACLATTRRLLFSPLTLLPHSFPFVLLYSASFLCLLLWYSSVTDVEPRSVRTLPAHAYEILTCDWNKWNEYQLATGSVDRTIRIWVSLCPPTPVPMPMPLLVVVPTPHPSTTSHENLSSRRPLRAD
jgi:WD40 repeat protein